MSEDDIDIYDDLPVLNLGNSVTKVEEEKQLLKQQLKEKENDLESTKERIELLKKENKILKVNISSLYKTAVNELQRKDQVIEELRREKDDIVFRRNSKPNQINHSSLNIFRENFDNFHNEDHQDASWPHKLIPVTLGENIEQSANNLPGFTRDSSDLPDHTLLNEEHNSSTSNDVISLQISDETLYKSINMEVSNVSENVISQETCGTALLSPNTCNNSHSRMNDTSSDKLSSCSSHAPYYKSKHRSDAREHLDHKNFSRERNERSTSSETRREERHKGTGFYSPSGSRNRHRSPHRRYSSSKFYYERSRREGRMRDHGNRAYYRDLHKGGDRLRKVDVDRSDDCRGKYYLQSESSSPKRPKRHNSPGERYSDRMSFNPIVNRYTKPPSNNIRMAAQVKSKYSRPKCERSVSCSPVKRKAVKSGKQSLEASDMPPKLSFQENNFNKQRIHMEDFGEERDFVHEQSVKRVCQEYMSEKSCSDSLYLKKKKKLQ